MNEKRIGIITKLLDELYPQTDIPLIHRDAFTLLIAVLLSAQSTDKAVNKVTPALFEKADNPYKMVKMSVDEIKEIIKSIGMSNKKSKSIHDLSAILIEKFEGKVPESFMELESLPGVGHKTASVIMSQAFKHPAFPVDTHIHRLAQRWGLSSGKNVEQTEKDLKLAFPEENWNKLHLQIIYYGREHCPARNHKIEKCIICNALKVM